MGKTQWLLVVKGVKVKCFEGIFVSKTQWLLVAKGVKDKYFKEEK